MTQKEFDQALNQRIAVKILLAKFPWLAEPEAWALVDPGPEWSLGEAVQLLNCWVLSFAPPGA